jgi:DNA-binding XRE family transcriptional regulator
MRRDRLEHNYIKDYRLLCGIRSQAELARLAGIPKSTLGEIERHKMKGNPVTLANIARVLGITVEALYVDPNLL